MRPIHVFPLLAAVLAGCVNESPDSASLLSPEPAAAVAARTGMGAGPMTGQPPDEAVVADLVYLREEEKVARDVYLTLLSVHGLGIFDNISRAEQNHMDAVLRLLETYGIPDPVTDDAVGVFHNAFLAQLYGELVDLGSGSVLAALTVGATIEDLDLYDIQAMVDRAVSRNVLNVYDSLSCGSRNHLRAFCGQLAMLGATYEAQYLTVAEVEAILASDQERCGRNR